MITAMTILVILVSNASPLAVAKPKSCSFPSGKVVENAEYNKIVKETYANLGLPTEQDLGILFQNRISFSKDCKTVMRYQLVTTVGEKFPREPTETKCTEGRPIVQTPGISACNILTLYSSKDEALAAVNKGKSKEIKQEIQALWDVIKADPTKEAEIRKQLRKYSKYFDVAYLDKRGCLHTRSEGKWQPVYGFYCQKDGDIVDQEKELIVQKLNHPSRASNRAKSFERVSGEFYNAQEEIFKNGKSSVTSAE